MFAPDTGFKADLVFDIGKLMEFNEGFYDILTSTFVANLEKLPVAGTYTVVSERFRPDLISHRKWGEEQFKIILMLYNGLTSYTQIVPGMTLLYPSFRAVEELMFESKMR